MFFSPSFLSRPYAIAAAVGSLMILITFRPAMTRASLVAFSVVAEKNYQCSHRKKSAFHITDLFRTIQTLGAGKNQSEIF